MVVVSPALCTPTSPYFSPWVRKSRRHRAIKLSVSNNLIDKGGGGVEQTECNVWIFCAPTANRSPSPLVLFEGRRCRRRMRGVVQLDGTRFQVGVTSRRSSRLATLPRHQSPPHPTFGHLLPHKKRGGEGLIGV